MQGPLEAAFQQAVAHHRNGRLREAEPLYRQVLQAMPRHADALHLLGVLALQVGQPAAAQGLIEQSLAVRPSANVWCDLGNALGALGRRADAIAAYRQALVLQPDLAEALCNLGQLLLEDGQADEAVASCRRAIALKPGFAEAHCNLGNALRSLGLVDAAVASYREALRLRPDLALVHGHLADALALLGRDEEAIAAYAAALAITPAAADLHARIGRAFRRRAQWPQAIASHLQALRLRDDAAHRQEFVQTIRGMHFETPHAEVRAWLIRALDEGWVDAGELLTPATSLVECHPAVREALDRLRRDGRAARLGAALLGEIAADGLLLHLLAIDALNSVPLERLLTAVRRQMLADALEPAAHDEPPDEALLRLQAAIAGQCFINEYVYAVDDQEAEQLARLLAQMHERIASGDGPGALIASAAYAPLSGLPGIAALAARPWPAPLTVLFTQQVTEPQAEARLREAIPRLTAIDDAVSREVQAQYEANPYPRWVRMPPPEAPCDLGALLRRQLPASRLEPRVRPGRIDVLIAGCGTGRHPISVARQLADASVLAVDLSRASLAYATRKTAEAGLSNIRYAQADILQLGGIGQRFDLIESAGVLHHLADPLAGWRVLGELLRPGGLMLLGLYSEAGRRDVVAARRRIAEQGLGAQAEDIRRCRQALMSDALAPQFAQFLSSRDFHSTSACRDLLFHVQEHRFTVPQLRQAIASLGLRFVGFVLDGDVNAAYDREHPDDPMRIDLDHWHAFETARPDTFARMYAFWVQKPGSDA